MKTKYFFLAALAGMTLASCSDDVFVGDNSPNVVEETAIDNGILFGGGFRAVTRGNSVGAAAAELLGNEFIVTGVKGDGTGKDQTNVFKSYTVNWAQNTAGTTESNTADWEYVGKHNYFGLSGAQAIKYWDFNTTAYDFAAFSVGAGNTIITTGTPSGSNILTGGITYNATQIGTSGKYEITSAYTLQGEKDALTKCYITDMKTVTKGSSPDYREEVELEFRSLATKVRMAIYETVPGYSVKDVEFFQDDATARDVDISANTSATLFGAGAFYASGTYTVSFPKIGSGNSSDPDYNKAHVAIIDYTEQTGSKQAFGTLNYTTAEDAEAAGTHYLGRTSTAPSFAGTSTWYQPVLPNENGAVLEMRVNYTLVATDGSGETIKIYGAKAYVPAAYTKWLPNYAYTYIFKISDNTNGWTNPTSDPAGLYPITFDAVVLSSEETGTQTTITTVATPSITTYQKGHVYDARDEYYVVSAADAAAAKDNDAIYAQVMKDGALMNDLSTSGKSYFYTITNVGIELSTEPTGWPVGYYTDPACTTPATGTFSSGTFYRAVSEASVMDALNIRTNESSGTITGRNGIVLAPATADYTVNKIPGEDDNWITQYYNKDAQTPGMENITAGMVARLAPDAAGTYAYVYQDATGSATSVITTVVVDLATTPTGWSSSDNKYYIDANCTTKANYEFEAGKVTLNAEPGDWNPVNNIYYTDAACTTKANHPYANGDYYRKIYYQKYDNLNNTYGVKVIKVVAAP